MQRKLTARQERFICEYLVDYNGAAAARRAGYAARSCRVQASQLLRDTRISAQVQVGMADLLAEVKATARETLQARARVAYFDPLAMVDAAGVPLPLPALDARTRELMAVSVEFKASGPVMRMRPASREAAFAALERAQRVAWRGVTQAPVMDVEEPQPGTFDRLQEKEAEAPFVPPVLDWPRHRARVMGIAAQPEAPVPIPPVAPENPKTPEPLPEPPAPPAEDPNRDPKQRDPGQDKPAERDPVINDPAREPGGNPPRTEPGRPVPQQLQRPGTDNEAGDAGEEEADPLIQRYEALFHAPPVPLAGSPGYEQARARVGAEVREHVDAVMQAMLAASPLKQGNTPQAQR